MSTHFKMWHLSVAALTLIALCLVATLYSGPRVRNTPLMREYARIHALCGKVVLSTTPEPIGSDSTNLNAFVRLGILTPEDAVFIREHNVKFYGFNSDNRSASVPLFETVFSNTRSPQRIVGYADGHTVMSDLEQRP